MELTNACLRCWAVRILHMALCEISPLSPSLRSVRRRVFPSILLITQLLSPSRISMDGATHAVLMRGEALCNKQSGRVQVQSMQEQISGGQDWAAFKISW